MNTAKLLAELRVPPGRPADLAKRDPSGRLGLGDKQAGLVRLNEQVAELSMLSNRLWAEARRSLLLVLQGLDAPGSFRFRAAHLALEDERLRRRLGRSRGAGI